VLASVPDSIAAANVAGGHRQLWFRVVRCLPPTTDVWSVDGACRAGVGEASREETAGEGEAGGINCKPMGILGFGGRWRGVKKPPRVAYKPT